MLPKIPYTMEKNKSQSIPIGNFNISCNFQSGDIADSRGISARKYPYLTTKKRDYKLDLAPINEKYAEYKIAAMTVFNGELATVRKDFWDMGLFIGNEFVCELEDSGGEKQLAVINTKLVIYPDRIYVEKVDGEWIVGKLEAKAFMLNPTFTANTISSRDTGTYHIVGRAGEFDAGTKSFTLSRTSLDLSKGWYLCGSYTSSGDSGCIYPSRQFTTCLPVEAQDDCSIMYLSSSVDLSEMPTPTRIDWQDPHGYWTGTRIDIEKDYNYETANGEPYVYKCKINGTSFSSDPPKTFFLQQGFNETQIQEIKSAKKCWISGYKLGETKSTEILGDNGAQITNVYADCFWINKDWAEENGSYCVELQSLSLFSWDDDALNSIKKGDLICVDGSVANRGSYKVKSIVDNVIYFDETDPSTQEMSSENIEGQITLYRVKEFSEAVADFKVGDAVTISGCEEEKNNITFVISKISGGSIHASADIFTAGEFSTAITIERKAPDLDFICEKDNRLYGVNNTEKTIYVSALGDPTNMYAYEGVSTDSFAVAVGGEGDFTACCKYGESVLFFKEDKLYKLVGSYPAEFALYSYDVPGVAAGSEKSCVVINEVLYYHGKNGIYAYTGGVPTLISENFGECRFSGAVGGSDGECYYVSLSNIDADDDFYLFSYNTRLGLWVLEDRYIRYTDSASLRGELCFLNEDGEVYELNWDPNPWECEWFVQFVPFYETIEGKKIYSRLLFRVEIPRGSYMIIEVRSDDGVWREAGKIVGAHRNVIPIRLPIARCDKFEIRLRGKGEFSILDILREYHVGSEV